MPDVFAIDGAGEIDEPDRFRAFPHPREMLACHGHAEAERELLEAWRGGRMHHGWLFAGPEGVGKAVMAYRLARFLLANPDPESRAGGDAHSLAVPASHPAAGLVARLAHPDLAVIRRSRGKDGKSLRTEIGVDDVRDGLSVFRTTSGAGGWRVAIVDAADDLNRNAANALLKMLEEPPKRALFILVAHRPGGLLPTIRSRCRTLQFKPLDAAAVRAVLASLGQPADPTPAMLASGGARAALRMADPGERALRAEAELAFSAGGKAVRSLAEGLAGRANGERFEVFLDVVEERLRNGLDGAAQPAALAARAELWEKLRRSAREIETFNLDRRPFVLSVLSDLAEIERRER